MEKFPKNMKEAVVASVSNASVMVLGMVTLNLWIYGALTPGHFLRVVPMMFVVVFLFDFFVAPIIESGTVITAHQYLMAAPRNYIAALALQVIIALPFGLRVLGQYRKYIA